MNLNTFQAYKDSSTESAEAIWETIGIWSVPHYSKQNEFSG